MIKQILKRIVPNKVKRYAREFRAFLQKKKIERVKIVKFNPKDYDCGINLIGPINQSSGLGQSCRLVKNALNESGIPYKLLEYSSTENAAPIKKGNLIYGINLFHVNAHEFEKAFQDLGKECWDGHYNIAFWLWEMDEFPDRWVHYVNLLDEIWTPAEYISQSMRKKIKIPIKTIPYCVTAECEPKLTRSDFGLPDNEFLYLMAFDSNSVSERKNPMAAIKAFKKAFTPEMEGVGLVIKISNIKEWELENLKEQLSGYRVYYIKNILSKNEMNNLVRLVDVYISLHRAEGFGLILAEAMLLGTPVIATNYSANTEFMNSEVACMVDYSLVELGKDLWPYEKKMRWAEPSVVEAAKYIEQLFYNRDYYNNLSNSAREYLRNKLGMERISKLFIEHYNGIYQNIEGK